MNPDNRLTKQIAAFTAGFVLFFFLLGLAGKADYQEAVINGIPCEAYDEIVRKVGTDADDIISEYRLHREYYDSLN